MLRRGWKRSALLTPDSGFLQAVHALAPESRGEQLALAVSGGGDSLGMLALALDEAPGRISVFTVDHALREGSADDAAYVAELCAERGVPASILTLDWNGPPPAANRQARARCRRYEALREACAAGHISWLLTAHHADDQAETLLMRLARGSGVAGLSGIRARRPLGGGVMLLRPFLWMRGANLRQAAVRAGFEPREDPANHDPAHDRTRFRGMLARSDLDPLRLSAAAAHLAQAEEALEWTAERAFAGRAELHGAVLTLDPHGLPAELKRRLVLRAFAHFGARPERGAELARFVAALEAGRAAALAGVHGSGGKRWTLKRE